MGQYRTKRAVDLLIAVPAVVLSLPLQGLLAMVVRLKLGTPVIFRQARPGRDGEPFELCKFRTMRPVDPVRGWTDDASRLTPFGNWLRATSLDELPTLWNVVRGDMSLVGPRPLLMEYLGRYSPHQARRHEVRPGMTGLAQVSGRNALTWEHKLDLDVEYVERCSPMFDIRIVGQTIGQVLGRHGITADGHATMPEFLGTSPRERSS